MGGWVGGGVRRCRVNIMSSHHMTVKLLVCVYTWTYVHTHTHTHIYIYIYIYIDTYTRTHTYVSHIFHVTFTLHKTNNTWWREQIKKLLFYIKFFILLSLRLSYKFSLQHHVRAYGPHSTKEKLNPTAFCSLTFLDKQHKDKRFSS